MSNMPIKVYCLNKGDIFVIPADKNLILKVGDKHPDCNAIVTQVFYLKRKWWQFWKKDEPLRYKLKYLGEE